jgi:hypothetical protein
MGEIRGVSCLMVTGEKSPGDLIYTFAHAWSDGTQGIQLSPWAPLQK